MNFAKIGKYSEKTINDLLDKFTPIVNIVYKNNCNELKESCNSFIESLGSIDGIHLNSSQVINLLDIGEPLKVVVDGDHRKIGLWIAYDHISETKIALWSDGFKKNPSRGTSYEIYIKSGEEIEAANFLKTFHQMLLDKHINSKERKLRPK